MYLLDTDHITILQRPTTPEFGRLAQRLGQHPANVFFWPIISFHEQVIGANNFINQARTVARLTRGYDMMEKIRVDFSTVQVACFDTLAVQCYERLRQQKVRIGTMDLRIAATPWCMDELS